MRRPYVASGPLVWLVTIGITTLLLVASARALWLVVPLLLAIILYYMLYPAVRRLELNGFGREPAAALVAGGFMVLAVLVLIPTVPWLIAQAVSGEEVLGRYLEGGRVLIERTLHALESQFGFLKRMNFHAEMSRRATEFGDTFMRKELAATLLSAAAQLPTLLLAPFIAFFMLRDGGSLMRQLIGVVPNAFFERTIYMFDRVHNTARNYFQGLLKLALADALFLSVGLWIIGVPGAPILGVAAALFEMIPVVGSALAFAMLVLAAAAEFPGDPWVVYAAVALFLLNRTLDAFVIMPLTVGRSIRMHPVPTVLMLFIGGAVAGIAGLVLALPLAGVVSAVVGTIGGIIDDPRLRARHAFARTLQSRRINADLQL